MQTALASFEARADFYLACIKSAIAPAATAFYNKTIVEGVKRAYAYRPNSIFLIYSISAFSAPLIHLFR